jgi:hypothetical protein
MRSERRKAIHTLAAQGYSGTALRRYLRTDQELHIRLKARALESMLVSTGMNFRDVTRMCIEVIYRMHSDQLWRFSEQEYESLRDWAHNNLNPFMDDSYMDRFVNAVQYMLAEIDVMGIVHPTTGDILTGLDVLRRADLVQLKERTYAFRMGTDEQKRQLALMLFDRAPAGDLRKFHREILDSPAPPPMTPTTHNLPDESGDMPSVMPDTPDPLPNNLSVTRRMKVRMLLEWDNTGWKASFPDYLSDAQIAMLQSILGDALDIVFQETAHA